MHEFDSDARLADLLEADDHEMLDLGDGTLRTDRLVLMPLTLDHVDDYHRVYSDPRTWEHLPSGRHVHRADSARAIERSLDSRRSAGFGYHAVLLRQPIGGLSAGSFVGTAGAAMLSFGAWNLGYRFDPQAWGHGLATEAARASLVGARAAQPDVPVTARALANNPASFRVLQRIGLRQLWRGASEKIATIKSTAHLERVVYADRPLDEATLEAVVALG
ncbi:MAG TPA: GNAT family N-acetyltransferase [Agromyces sp.]|nr:GNAT family N-acetyltransferase [Agromyces sp.]